MKYILVNGIKRLRCEQPQEKRKNEKIVQILRVLLGTMTRLENIWWTIRKIVKGNMQHQRLSTI